MPVRVDDGVLAYMRAAGGAIAYDPGTDLWQQLEPMAVARTMISAAMGIAGCLYTVGGYADGKLTSDVDAYAA